MLARAAFERYPLWGAVAEPHDRLWPKVRIVSTSTGASREPATHTASYRLSQVHESIVYQGVAQIRNLFFRDARLDSTCPAHEWLVTQSRRPAQSDERSRPPTLATSPARRSRIGGTRGPEWRKSPRRKWRPLARSNREST